MMGDKEKWPVVQCI